MRNLGTIEVPSRFSQSFPAQGDKENIEGKDVSGIQTAHHKHLNKGKVLQHRNDQEPNHPSSFDLSWQDLSLRRFPHPDSPTNGMVRPYPKSRLNHLDQQAMNSKEHSTGDPER